MKRIQLVLMALKLRSKLPAFYILLWIYGSIVYSQEVKNPSSGFVDMGMGAIISIGLQNEVGFDIRTQFIDSKFKNTYLLGYHRFFRREFENREVFNEFELSYHRTVYKWNGIYFLAGVGYFLNNYDVSELERNTSSLFISSGNYNHGVGLKARFNAEIITKVNLFCRTDS